MSQLPNLCNQEIIKIIFFLILFLTVILRLLSIYKKLLKKECFGKNLIQ